MGKLILDLHVNAFYTISQVIINLCNSCVQWQKWSKTYLYSSLVTRLLPMGRSLVTMGRSLVMRLHVFMIKAANSL